MHSRNAGVCYASLRNTMHLHLDSRLDAGTGGIIAAYQVEESLVATDPETGEAVPGLAVSWDVSEDGLTYTFHLRHGVKFHDGTDFTSADVMYTFEFITGAREGGRYSGQFGPYFESISAPDDYTFVVQLAKPWGEFLASMQHAWAFLIVSQEAIESAGDAYGSSVMVGTGPFKFVSWTPGESIVLERNDDYWDADLPYVDGVEFRLIRDGTARVLNVRTGSIDIAYDPPIEQLRSLGANSGLQVIQVPGNPMTTFQMNTSVAPFTNLNVRRALYYGLNRQSIVDALYGDYAQVAYTLMPSWHWLYNPDLVGIRYDPERARELLAGEGYGPTNPLKFTMMIGPDSESQELGVIIQAMYAEIGVQVELWTVDSTTKFAILEGRNGQDPSQYVSALWAQTLPGSTTDDYIQKPYGAAGTLNYTWINKPGGYQDAELERLINAARTAPNRDQARDLYEQAIRRINDDAVLVPILHKKNVSLLAANVEGFTPLGTNSFPLSHVWLR